MPEFDVVFIGTGPDPETPDWGTSAAMAYRHARGYEKRPDCNLVACADLVHEHGIEFADRFNIPREEVCEDYEEMLSTVGPDIVSICTPVPTHANIVLGCIDSGVVDAIHCEKPMATTWRDCQRMRAAADNADVQLTFNHQRRFGPAWREAKRLLDDGVIGDLERVEIGGKNLYDYGTHLIDLCHYFNDERSAEWVLAQIDYREEDVRYGAHNENQAIAHWEYDNGVYALAATGTDESMVGCQNRIVGTEGMIEVDHEFRLGIRQGGTDWQVHEFDKCKPIHEGVHDLVESLTTDEEPELSAARTTNAMEITSGGWESVRQRGRVEFPLDIDDNPLEAMIESGALQPRPTDD
jgi:UDP-N-acetylglucosamine 3-dehydrogenase